MKIDKPDILRNTALSILPIHMLGNYQHFFNIQFSDWKNQVTWKIQKTSKSEPFDTDFF